MRRAPWTFALSAAIAWMAWGAAAWGDARLRVDFLSVGQGDAALVTSPTGKTALIDGGPRQAGASIAAFLRERGVGPLDLVLLTHRHADHLGGLAEVIRTRGARIFMDAPYSHPSPAYAALVRLLADRSIAVRQATVGRAIDLGAGARLVLLSPPDPVLSNTRSDVNANSVVALLEYKQTRILFAADAEAATETWLLERHPDLRATVLKVAHHGSRHSSTAPFLRAVSPRVAIVSAGEGNPYRHPANELLERLSQAGARIYRTDQDGTITLETDGDRVFVSTKSSKEVLTVR